MPRAGSSTPDFYDCVYPGHLLVPSCFALTDSEFDRLRRLPRAKPKVIVISTESFWRAVKSQQSAWPLHGTVTKALALPNNTQQAASCQCARGQRSYRDR